jgi:hypothetical protein
VLAAPALASVDARRAQHAPGPRCGAQVTRQLRDWRVAAVPVAQPALRRGGTLRHWPTDALGVWVVEDASPDHAVVMRVGPAELERMEWSAACEPVVTTTRRLRPPAPSFSDEDLAALLASADRGVIYLWSPHMPLSVDGHAHVARAAGARGLALHVLLDPNADSAFAASSAADAALPASALRVADSVELQFRELVLHAPAAALFANGRLVGPVLRGYRTAAEYAEFFDRTLAAQVARR